MFVAAGRSALKSTAEPSDCGWTSGRSIVRTTAAVRIGRQDEALSFIHFLPTFPQRGGAGVLVQGLVEAGRRQGRQDRVLSYGNEPPAAGTGLRGSATRLLIASPVPLPLGDPVVDQLVELDARDAVVLHGAFTPSCARLSIAVRHRRPDLPVVASPHDAYDAGLFGTRSALKHAYWRSVERPYLRRVDIVVAAAPSHTQVLVDLGVKTTVLIAPPGLTPDDVTQARLAAAARDRRTAGVPLRLLALGRWDIYEKGLDLLCEAAEDPSLRGRISVRLVGPEQGARPAVESLLRRHRLDNFEAVGFVDDVWPELVAADALLLPSRKEGFGLVALQALASGLPVLLSSAAGIGEYVTGESGVVLVHPDAAAVRAGLHDLVDRHGALTVLARGDRQRFAERFTCDRNLTLLSDLLSRS
jgi:glycosyltransferase involved in cell wall biosynthesis